MEQNVVKPFITSKHDVSPSESQELHVTLSPEDLDAQLRFYPRRGDVVQFKCGSMAEIRHISVDRADEPVLHLIPALSTKVLPNVNAGEKIEITDFYPNGIKRKIIYT